MTFVRNTLFICCIALLSFFCYMNEPLASSGNVETISIVESDRLFAGQSDGVCQSVKSCDNLFGDPDDVDCTAYWMQWILNIAKYVAIAALLVLSTVDFIKALASNDKDALKKASMTTAKRFIFVVILFFLPIIVDFIMRLFGAYGTCGIG